MSARLPITIIAGYLGSGKTTLINNTLNRPGKKKLAIVVNDFGQINIDASLIQAEGAETIELSNGCVCCSIGDDLGATLSQIAAWPDPPDHVLLEASGIAEPARIAVTAGNWPGYRLASRVITADATTIRARASDKFVKTLILSQLRSADVIALTKTDLLIANQVDAVRIWLANVAPEANMVLAPNGTLPVDLLLGTAPLVPVRTPSFSAYSPLRFANACWRLDSPIDVNQLRDCLATLPAHVHRAKGIVTDTSTGTRLMVQYASSRLDMTPTTAVAPSCLVFISVGSQEELDELCQQLRARFAL